MPYSNSEVYSLIREHNYGMSQKMLASCGVFFFFYFHEYLHTERDFRKTVFTYQFMSVYFIYFMLFVVSKDVFYFLFFFITILCHLEKKIVHSYFEIIILFQILKTYLSNKTNN